MNHPTHGLKLLLVSAIGLACAERRVESQCFAVDPRGVWDADDIELLYASYCDRGSTRIDGLRRLPEFHCIPAPEQGCDPCMLDRDAADAILLEKYMMRLEQAECPSDYGPEQMVRGCFAELPALGQCCWTSEFYFDEQVCDPGPQKTYP